MVMYYLCQPRGRLPAPAFGARPRHSRLSQSRTNLSCRREFLACRFSRRRFRSNGSVP